MSLFDDFLGMVKEGVIDIAKEEFGDFNSEIKSAIEISLEKSKNDLKNWTKLLALGEISQQEFKDLLEAKRALIEIQLLTQKGITQTKIERFRNKLIDLVFNSAIKNFL